jgi:hypothetical protein
MIALIVGVVANAVVASPGPNEFAYPERVAAPLDQPFPGTLRLAVDASDVERRIVPVR